MKEEKKLYVGLHVTQEMKESLRLEAKRQHTNVSTIIRKAVAGYLDAQKPKRNG